MLPTGKVEVVTGSSAHGQGHETAWSQIVADKLGRAVRGHPGAARRHPGLAQGHGHLRLPLADRRRHRPRRGLRQGDRQGQADRRAHAGGQRERHRVRRTAGFTCAGTRSRARTIQEIALATFAAHDLPDGVEPSLDSDATYDPDNFSFPHGTHLCAIEVDTETGRVDDPLVRGRGRRRQGDQPADRRGPGARRPGPGHRAGAVRGGRLRRRRQPDHHHPGRLPGAVRRRPAALHDRPDRDAGHHQPARRQGRRRGGHDRVHAGGGQRDRRRAAADGHRRRRDAVHAGAGLAGHPVPRAIPARDRTEAGNDPGEVRLRQPGSVDEAVRALADGGEDAKVIAGGQSLLPLLRLRLAYPDLLVDLGGLGGAARRPRRGRDAVDRRAHHASTRRSATRSSPSTAGCSPRRPALSPTRPSATAARSAGPWPTPTRPGTCPRWRRRWTPR